METIITIIILVVAICYLIKVFGKRAKGKGGCQCQGQCKSCVEYSVSKM